MIIKGIFFDAAGIFYRRPEPTRKYVSNLLQEKGLSTVGLVARQERAEAFKKIDVLPVNQRRSDLRRAFVNLPGDGFCAGQVHFMTEVDCKKSEFLKA